MIVSTEFAWDKESDRQTDKILLSKRLDKNDLNSA